MASETMDPKGDGGERVAKPVCDECGDILCFVESIAAGRCAWCRLPDATHTGGLVDLRQLTVGNGR